MKKTVYVVGMLLIVSVFAASYADAFQNPTLKWRVACGSSCGQSWYSPVAVADLNNDGKMVVIGAQGNRIYWLDGATGKTNFYVHTGYELNNPSTSGMGRTWPPIIAADIDGDGNIEIISAHNQDKETLSSYLSVYSKDGYFKTGWPQFPTGTIHELRGLSVYDLDSDGKKEIIVTARRGNPVNTWVYQYDGTLRTGWPRLSPDPDETAWGVDNNNLAVGDLDGDGKGEIISPSDTHYIHAYKPDGTQVSANSIYKRPPNVTGWSGKWGDVGTWESLNTELRGWGTCKTSDRAENYRPNFREGVAAITDVNNDGKMEVVVTGNVEDCPGNWKYTGVFIFNADRSRFNADGFDWTTVPMDTGVALTTTSIIERVQPNLAVADIDGDGLKEIIYPSYDGKVHAFWLNKTHWAYSVYNASEGVIRFASPAAVADLENDGKAEIIFTSWTQKSSKKIGKLHIVDYQGHKLFEQDLPLQPSGVTSDWNGAMAAPTLADIDGDGNLEMVISTVFSGIVAYTLPDTSQAKVYWSAGREVYQPPVPCTQIIQGDLNKDCRVNLKDAIIGLQVCADLNPLNIVLTGDANNDGKIGLEDIIFILQKVAGLR